MNKKNEHNRFDIEVGDSNSDCKDHVERRTFIRKLVGILCGGLLVTNEVYADKINESIDNDKLKELAGSMVPSMDRNNNVGQCQPSDHCSLTVCPEKYCGSNGAEHSCLLHVDPCSPKYCFSWYNWRIGWCPSNYCQGGYSCTSGLVYGCPDDFCNSDYNATCAGDQRYCPSSFCESRFTTCSTSHGCITVKQTCVPDSGHCINEFVG